MNGVSAGEKGSFCASGGLARAPVKRAFELIQKKLEKGIDAFGLHRIMRGSLRDMVSFSGLPKDTRRRKRIVANTSFACIMVGPP